MRRFFAFALAAAILWGCSGGGSSGKFGVNTQAPDFTLPTVDGSTISLSELRGKVVVLNFWATWCPPCRMEIPGFARIARKYSPDRVVVVGVSLDYRLTRSQLRDYAKRLGINYIVAVGAADPKITQKFGNIRSIPTTLIIDQNGIIRERIVGAVSEEYLERKISALLPPKA